jgi:hypothetical protein
MTRISKEVVEHIQILVGRLLVKTVVQCRLTGRLYIIHCSVLYRPAFQN